MSTDPWRYDGRTVVVTGCTSGIGHAVAEEVSSLGASVIGLDRNPTDSSAVDQFVQVDLTDTDAIDRALVEIETAVHVLFNCAGLSGACPARDVMGVNFVGMRHLTEAVVAEMEAGGAVASISSTGGVAWQKRVAALEVLCATETAAAAYQWCDAHAEILQADSYNLSKSAVIYYTMQRAVDLARRGIRINAIGPGPTETPFLEASRQRLGNSAIDALPKPLGRFARADEQARALVFLGSDAASYITGQNLWVDGGYFAGAVMGDIDGSFLGLEPIPRKLTVG